MRRDAYILILSLVGLAAGCAGPRVTLRAEVLREGQAPAPVQPNTSLKSGDVLRMHVEAEAPGYLYVVHAAPGQPGKLLPLQSASDLQFKLDDNPGPEEMYVVVSRRPLEERELSRRVGREIPPPRGGKPEDVHVRIRRSPVEPGELSARMGAGGVAVIPFTYQHVQR